ncbi:MAG TPA: sigma-54 dependent transcriptional regulator [Pirellulales bacterium]
MPTLLVVDDDASILHFFRRAFESPEVTLVTASSIAEALEKVVAARPDVIVLDLNLADESGLDAFRRIREIDAKIPVIFITGQGTTDTAIEAMRQGAYEYLLKPLELDQLTDLIGRAFEISRLARVPALLPESAGDDADSDILVGRCPAMQQVYKSIGRAAPQDVTVLIVGESGTGKELVARAIYHYSRRDGKPFLAINCAAIPEPLLESELFVHEKGSFTGADRRRIGKFEQCDGGTLFLDEIGDMTPLTQTKVLRVIQGQPFERLGGSTPIATDVRLVAATNRDLPAMIEAGDFRRDLYYRLNVYTISLPPLRDRDGDVALLARHFLRRFARQMEKDVQTISPEALAMLSAYSWPGNVRELQSVIKQALLLAIGPVLLPEFLPAVVRESGGGEESLELTALSGFIQRRLKSETGGLYADYQRLTERHLLTEVMRHAKGNVTQAAKMLGIARNTLRSKLEALAIDEVGED